mgnify:CR=1 FL=1
MVFPSSKPLILLYSHIRVLSSKIVQCYKNFFWVFCIFYLTSCLYSTIIVIWVEKYTLHTQYPPKHINQICRDYCLVRIRDTLPIIVRLLYRVFVLCVFIWFVYIVIVAIANTIPITQPLIEMYIKWQKAH